MTGNYKMWERFVDVSLAALRDTARHEWNQRYPNQQWTDNDPDQITRFRRLESEACNGNIPLRFQSVISDMQKKGANIQIWDLRLLSFFICESRCLDLKNRNPTLVQCVESIKSLRDSCKDYPNRNGMTYSELKDLHSQYTTHLTALTVPTKESHLNQLNQIFSQHIPQNAANANDGAWAFGAIHLGIFIGAAAVALLIFLKN